MVTYVSEDVLERLQPVNRLILSEQKERELRQEEDQKDSCDSEPSDAAGEKNQAHKDSTGKDLEETLESLRKEVSEEEARRAKALRHQYKYKEIFGAIFYSDIPSAG